MLQTAVFDLDDTLIDQQSAMDSACMAWAAEHGIIDDDVVARWRLISTRHFRRWQAREIGFEEQRCARVREFLGQPLATAQALAAFGSYLERYEAGWRLYDDALAALRRARAAGLNIVILTNGERAQQMQKLARFALDPMIDALVCSSELPAGKPDPRSYAAALSPFGTPPEHALMIGDSVENDYLGALDCGMRAVLVIRDGRTVAETVSVASLDDIDFGA